MGHAVELAEVPQLFERWLAGRPLADRSRREYARNVRVYCVWLAATADRDGWQGDPLSDPLARDHAARVFAAICRSRSARPRRRSTSRSPRSTLSIGASVSGVRTCGETSRRWVRRVRWTKQRSGACCAPPRALPCARGRW